MDAVSLLATCALFFQGAHHTPSCNGTHDPLRSGPIPVAGQRITRHDHSGIGQWREFVTEAAQEFAIPESWIRAVMGQESGGRTTLNGKPITSSAGATGLMQVMPGTYAGLRRRYSLGSDSYDPHDNILAGTAYLRQMYERYGYPSLFAAYNAGPARFDAYLFGRKQLPNETLHYVESILPGVEMTLNNSQLGASAADENPSIQIPPLTSPAVQNAALNRSHGDRAPAAPRPNSRSIFIETSAQSDSFRSSSRDGLFVPLSSTPQ
jgi:hypothetical protein